MSKLRLLLLVSVVRTEKPVVYTVCEEADSLKVCAFQCQNVFVDVLTPEIRHLTLEVILVLKKTKHCALEKLKD